MRLGKTATILAASLSLASTPVLAQTSPVRASAPMVEASLQEEESEGFNAGWIVAGIILIAVVYVLYEVYVNDEPFSA